MAPDSVECPRIAASDSGWTLLELMLALAIGMLVIALVCSAYHTVMQMLERRAIRQGGDEEVFTLLDRITTDLTRIVLPGVSDACPLLLETETTGNPPRVTLSFCTALPDDPGHDMRWYDVHHVTYALRESSSNRELIRVVQPQAGPGNLDPPVTNVLIGRVVHFRPTFYREGEWDDTWSAKSEDPLPRAVRLELALENNGGEVINRAAEVFLPVGSRVEPSGMNN